MRTSWLRTAGAAGLVLAARTLVRRRRRLDLRDRVAVVTGGSRGLGLELARELIARGAQVAICARDEAELERARAELATDGGRVLAVTCDVTDADEVTAMVAEVEDELGPIDVLINNAGIIQVAPAALMTRGDYEAALRTHLWGPLNTILAIAPAMRRRRAGRIINIASIGGKVAVPHLAPYSASKFALVGLSEGLRAELAADGILVTTVCPGLVRTGGMVQAQVRGHHEAEYAWFAVADSVPVLSMDARRAARRIVDACERGEAEVVLTAVARLAALAHGVAPGLVQEVLALVARALPPAEGGRREAAKGKDVRAAAPSVLTALGDRAARRNNEL